MEIKAKLNYLRISPRKVRLVCDLIKGLDIKEAETQLKFLPKRAALPILKLLNQAIANAKHNFGIEKENLFISKILVNTGPILKRWRARSRGMAVPIKKRSSHIELILEKREEKKDQRVEGVSESEKVEKAEKIKEAKKIVFRPEREIAKPKIRGIARRVFRRKAF